MPVLINMPSLSPTMKEGKLSKWLKNNPELYDYSQILFPIIQGSINHNFRKKSRKK